MENLTMVIKTFERFECVKRLVKSIYTYYPDAIIVIGDDSEQSCKQYFDTAYPNKNLIVYELPSDCGLSYGRNYLLKQVQTDYFLLLDDDFVFDKKTDIEYAFSLLKEKKLDILGGYLRNYKTICNPFDRFLVFWESVFRYEVPANYIGKIQFDEENRDLYVNYIIHDFPEFVYSDIVLNFFIAKTIRIIEDNPWDEELKLQEHTPFFFMAKQKQFKIAFTNHLSIRHKPVRLKKYNNFRGRDFVQLFMEKYDIHRIISTKDGSGETIRNREHD